MDILAQLSSIDIWIAFITLTGLELVLGIDNIIFISILVDRLPKESKEKARIIGLFLAMFMRILLLTLLSWMAAATNPLFSIMEFSFSPRDLILLGGGLFLIWKSTQEIHQLYAGEEEHEVSTVKATFSAIIMQIIVIDIVFSLDSIITAVGMVKEIFVMVAAVVASVGLMIAFAGKIGAFVSEHPTIKMLALSFLLVVGVTLVAEGFGHAVPKAYIYFAMAFSLGVETLNLRLRTKGDEFSRIPKPKSENAKHDVATRKN